MTFSLSFPSGGMMEFKQGEQISVNFPDGKGVSARIADVSIGPGGSPFSIICTSDGKTYPSARSDAFSTADGAQFLKMPRRRPTARQQAEADAYTNTEWCPECTADEDPAPWCDCRPSEGPSAHDGPCRLLAHHPDECPRLKRAEGHERVLKENEVLREQIQTMMEQLTATEAARAEWERNSRNWEAQYQTLSQMTTPTTQIHNVYGAAPMVGTPWHQGMDADGIKGPNYSIGVEKEPETFTFQTEEVPVPTAVKETFQVESPSSRVRVSYDPDGSVEIEIQNGVSDQ
jgi:hypothetical protein